MAEILFLAIFFVLVMILSIVMFFINKDDFWLQLLWIMTFMVHLIFLMFTMHDMNNIQMDYATSLRTYHIDGANKDSTNLSQEVINVSNRNHVSNFDFSKREESYFRDVNFCFKYNNSDAVNSVTIVSERDEISGQIYLPNNTLGVYCAHINNTYAKEGHYLGINCNDCNVGNKLGIVLDNNGVSGTAWNIDATNPNSFTLENHKPYLFWIEARTVPYEDINASFFTYLWVLGSLVLVFGSYLAIKVIKGESERALK